jgi:hypothetical protein
LYLAHDLVVPKPQDAVSGVLQVSGPSLVTATHLVEAVLRSVDFDHDPQLVAGEVDDIWTNWRLPAPMARLKRQCRCQPSPELSLCVGHGAAERTRPWGARVFAADRHGIPVPYSLPEYSTYMQARLEGNFLLPPPSREASGGEGSGVGGESKHKNTKAGNRCIRAIPAAATSERGRSG